VDFLFEHKLHAPNIVTNPPFKLGEQFARHSLALGARKVAFLLRLTWLEGTGRRDIVERVSRVHVFSARLSMKAGETGAKGGMVPYAWFVWDHSHSGPPQLGWL
jgi:hypothetical protein